MGTAFQLFCAEQHEAMDGRATATKTAELRAAWASLSAGKKAEYSKQATAQFAELQRAKIRKASAEAQLESAAQSAKRSRVSKVARPKPTPLDDAAIGVDILKE